MTRYLFCSKFTGKIQFLLDKRTLKWYRANGWISSKNHSYGFILSEESKTKLIDYADAEYLSDPHKALSQARYMFACGGTIISWQSMKQMLLCRNKSPPWSKSKSASGWNEWYTIFRKCVVFLRKIIYQPQCTKIENIIARN